MDQLLRNGRELALKRRRSDSFVETGVGVGGGMAGGGGAKDMRNFRWENKEARSSSCQTDEKFQTGGEVIF